MKFKSEEYSITNVMPTKEGDVPAICISKKALEEWEEHYTKLTDKFLKAEDRLSAFYYQGMAVCLLGILNHFEEEEV